MEIIKNNTGELEATLVVKISENDYAQRVDNELKKIRKNANIKGFRPGHVPVSVIKRLYGKDVVAQEVTKLLDEKIKEYLEKEKIEIIGDLLNAKNEETKFDVDKDKDFQFAFDFGYFPETKIDLEQITVPFYKIKLEDKTIDEEIENLRKRYGDFVEVEQAGEKSQIRFDFVELDENGNPKENGVKVEDALVVIDLVKDEDTRKKFIGLKKDDKLTIDVKKAFPNETDLAALLKIDKEKLNEISNNFELTVKKIEDYKEAELNQEFFDKLFGKDQVKSVEELREKIKEIIEKQYADEAKIRLRYDIKKALKDSIDIPLPDDFIVRWQMKSRKIENEEEIRKELPELKDALKWDRIIGILAKEHNVEIDHRDLLDATKANLINQLAQMGLSVDMFTDEQLDQFAEQELERLDENNRYYLVFATLERKVLDAIADKVNKEEKEITFDELKEIYEKERKELEEKNNKNEKQEKVEESADKE